MKKFLAFLPHLALALSLCVATITVLDGYNPLMRFLTSNLSKGLIYTGCAVFFLNAFTDLIERDKREKRRERRAAQRMRDGQ